MRGAAGHLFAFAFATAWTTGAAAQSAPAGSATPPPAPPEETGPVAPLAPNEEAARIAKEIERAPPPPSHVVYFQYGVAFTTEQVVSPGPICDDPTQPCVLGAGGGLVIRGGWRSAGSLYLGGAYELTKQDPSKLYRIALLQQARAEARYYIQTYRVAEPYVTASLGAVGYGNEWKVDTYGPAGSLGVGIEYQVTQRTVVGLAASYRLAYFSRFVDTTKFEREGGVAQLFGIDLVLEQRDAFLTADRTR
ncbi:MAG: hypothetical protein KIT84_41195 [Labilithrix sp.]|nr:hypothetical protein [Labilithrix sp.]MCW5817487.1 hypothetical protein [Labilithrix sp.]